MENEANRSFPVPGVPKRMPFILLWDHRHDTSILLPMNTMAFPSYSSSSVASGLGAERENGGREKKKSRDPIHARCSTTDAVCELLRVSMARIDYI